MTDHAREQWLEERRKGIGGSDCASLFNIGYGCRRRLWYDKRAVPEDFEREETKLMKLGRVLEPFFAEEFARQTDRIVSISNSCEHPTIPQLRVNADRLQWKTIPGFGMGILEIKSVGREVFYRVKREGLPEDYILQLQHGMLVIGAKWGSFAIGSRDSGDLLWWDVDADQRIHEQILEEAPKFWALVENGPAPDRLDPEDRRCQSCSWRVTCQGEALAGAPVRDGDYEPDESLRPLVLEYIERRALRKEADELLSETKAELEQKLGDRGMVTAAGAKIQFYKFTKKEYTVKAHEERPLRVYEGKK